MRPDTHPTMSAHSWPHAAIGVPLAVMALLGSSLAVLAVQPQAPANSNLQQPFQPQQPAQAQQDQAQPAAPQQSSPAGTSQVKPQQGRPDHQEPAINTSDDVRLRYETYTGNVYPKAENNAK